MTPLDIKSKLQGGDIVEIVRLTGVSQTMVSMILAGARNANTVIGKKVISAAKEIVRTRESLKKKFTA
jgi:DNA-binding LacI/PurR family transcriptional regulator